MKIVNVNFSEIISSKKFKDFLIIFAVLAISGLSHGYNMFNFPYYENDEGTYLSQAWSVLEEGQLAPYTYWYDHAPAGWILMAVWIKLTGGFFTFGPSINSGRVLMLVLHLATTLLLYYVTKRLSGKNFPAIVATMLFSLSPLAIYFQRRVLLDNIMIFWVFVSLALLLTKTFKLSSALLSAAAFGLAVLTKETALFLLPAFIYTIFTRPFIRNKVFTLVQWLTSAGLIISVYFLYAALRGELFPTGFLGDTQEHVSLLSSLFFQFSRGARLPFWNASSDFYTSLQEWINKDTFTVTLGAASTIVSTLLAVRIKALRIPALVALLFWAFLMRGDLIIDFYVIPAIPLLALNLGMLLEFLFSNFSYRVNAATKALSLALIVLGLFYLVPVSPYVRNETKPQIEAINWIKENLPADTFVVIDNYAFIDLRESRFPGDKVFPNADWFWKLDYDPALRNIKYEENWHKIEYIALSHEMVRQMKHKTQKMLENAFINSHPIIEWKDQSIAYVDLESRISTNGDWLAIYKMNDNAEVSLKHSWEYFKGNFIINWGQVIDPSEGEVTTSELQGQTLLRAVWEDDQTTFDNVWQWTKNHLQYRQQDKLLSFLWEKQGSEYKLGDFRSSSKADQDIALALLFAHKQWGNETYLNEAKEIISDIWEQEVKLIGGRYILIAGTDRREKEGFLVNPSAFAPATYRIFAEVDKTHPWKKLADSSYDILNTLGKMAGNQTYLPQNWILIDEQGNFSSAARYVDRNPDLYGEPAYQTLWRVAVDALWFKDTQAITYLKQVEPFFLQIWRRKGKFISLYDLSGREKANSNSLSTDSGALSVFSITNPQVAKEIFNKSFISQFDYRDGCWTNTKDFYEQSWGWFGTALYSRKLPNLWSSYPTITLP
ncbi:MAG: glycosyl hydrolase family 8 [Patescibacteria group bacterium]|jgi:endo-1,4-beta-D-glucanase Y/4-amino-4-deoxy-L-arabinose transferase-like glycosyltransferase